MLLSDNIPKPVKVYKSFRFDVSTESDQYVGNCPFCSDEGHFYFDQKDGRFDCKKCGVLGNPLTFLRQYIKDVASRGERRYARLSRRRGIRSEVLQEWDICWADDISRWVLPMHNAAGEMCSGQLYDPNASSGEKSKWNIGGLDTGLFGLHLLTEDRPIILCEGAFDAMIVYDYLYRQGSEDAFDVLGVPGANTFKPAWSRFFKKREVYVCYDYDDGGDAGFEIVRKRLSRNVLYRLDWSSVPDVERGIDMSDLLNQYEVDLVRFVNDYSVLENEPRRLKSAESDESAEQAEVLNPDGDNPFPLDVFPAEMRDLVTHGAKSLNCSREIIASSMLAVVGTALGGEKRITVKPSYHPTPTIWMATVADSGHRKTPALALVIDPLVRLEYKFEKEHKKAVKEKAEDDPDPVRRRIVTTDATMESLVRLLRDNPHGLIIYSDELLSWVDGINKYRGGKGNDQTQLMSIFSNSQTSLDRVTGESVSVESPFLCVAGCIQPSVLYRLGNNNNMTNGFVARLLFTYPPPVKMEYDEEGIAFAVTRKYEQLITRIYRWQDESCRCHCPRYSKAAKSLIKEWWDKHFADELPQLKDESLKAAWHKFEDYFHKFSLILHESHRMAGNIEYSYSEIHLDNVRRAIKLIEYYKREAVKVHAEIQRDTMEQDLEKLLEWIRSRDGEVTARDLVTYRKAKNTKEAKALLVDLVSTGHGTIDQPRSNQTVFTLNV